jgi:hypothetical protein
MAAETKPPAASTQEKVETVATAAPPTAPATQPVVVQGTPLTSPTAPAVKRFRLKDDKKHIQDNVVLRPGDVVFLTRAQATAFADKFDAVDPGEKFHVADAAELRKVNEDLANRPALGQLPEE